MFHSRIMREERIVAYYYYYSVTGGRPVRYYYYISLSLKARVLPSASLFSKEGVITMILQLLHLLHTVRYTLHDDQGPNSVLRITILKFVSSTKQRVFCPLTHRSDFVYKIWIYLFIILSRTISSDLHYFLLNFNPLENISPRR